jgi:hypothetical protein
VALFYAATLFASAFLLFLLEPMVGKMVLPLLGGTPAVWNTCMVVFQALLLAGYAYAHAGPKRFGVRRQSVLHLALLGVTVAAMGATAAVTGAPVSPVRALAPQGSQYPFFGVVLLLVVMVGLPFFVLATTAPLLQEWFSRTKHKEAHDPYFLYAASNLGSLLALVAYPAVVEPSLPLARQAWLVAGGFLVFFALTAGCARLLWRVPEPLPSLAPDYKEPPVPLLDRLRWLALAFVPSSLMLGVTTYASIDIAPIPLLWVIPLGLYLATFIIAFSRGTPRWLPRAAELIAPVFILMLVFSLTTDLKPGFNLNLVLHFLAFAAIALYCHVELARRRPAAGRVSEFWLWVALGGVIGGLFNALVAPVAFRDLLEYPIALIAAALLLPKRDEARGPVSFLYDLSTPMVVAALILLLQFYLYDEFPKSASFLRWDWLTDKVARAVAWTSEKTNVSPANVKMLASFGPPALVAYYFVDRPLRFGLSVLAIWAVGVITFAPTNVVHQERSYFGILKVQREDDTGPDGEPVQFHKLVHGLTTHGMQFWDPLLTDPLTYYHRTGPVGHLFAAFEGPKQKKEVALIGLGTGSTAAYGEPGMHLTYYEIDWAVRRIAENPNYFTYLQSCKADKLDIVMGDARLMMEKEAKPGQYDLILVDAFSSDAIPVHLLTKEAIAMYLDKLAPDGIIMLHISNRFLNLKPVCARLMQEHGLAGLVEYDTYKDPYPGKLPAQWVALARRRDHFGAMLDMTCEDVDDNKQTITRKCWSDLTVPAGAPLWTDDFSNIVQIYYWPWKKDDDSSD